MDLFNLLDDTAAVLRFYLIYQLVHIVSDTIRALFYDIKVPHPDALSSSTSRSKLGHEQAKATCLISAPVNVVACREG